MDKVDKYTEDINRMLGGKPFIEYDGSGPPEPIDLVDNKKPDEWQKDPLDQYKGQWDILFIIGNDKTCMGGCCEDKIEIERRITLLLKDRANRPLLRLSHPDIGSFLQGNISMMTPMPVR